MSAAPEVMFYHLERQSLETALPVLVEKSLERGWRAVIQAGSEERLASLDSLLWTYKPDSFVPHGTTRDGDPARQPVLLTTEGGHANGADVRFLVDGASTDAFTGHRRFVVMFDGRDAQAIERARGQYRAAKAAGCSVTYWQQTAEGGWQKKA